MTSQVEQRLKENNLTLPEPGKPVASYVPYREHEGLVYISGQVPLWNGELKYIGKVGKDFSVEEGQEAARLCALNLLAQLKAACEGDLSKVDSCLRLSGFVNCTDDFTKQSFVINGASDLMVQAFEDKGRHARTAIGVNSLPLGVAVEVEGIFKLKS